MSEDLKLCSHCNSFYIDIDHDGQTGWYGECVDCGCNVGPFEDKAEAERHWNRRPIEDALRAELEQARATIQNKDIVLESYRAERDRAYGVLAKTEARLLEACHVKADDKVGFDWAVLDELHRLHDQLARADMAVTALNIELGEARERERWIPCAERLPGEIFVVWGHGRTRLGRIFTGDVYLDDNGEWRTNTTPVGKYVIITHWQEIKTPNPPEQESE